MTSQPMTCTEFQDALGAYLEGDLDPATEAAAERHRASCAHCAALASDLERIAADAAALPTLSAGRDLWVGIAERISTPVVELTGRGGVPTGLLRVAPRRWRNWPLAAAAAALVAVTAGLTYQVTAR